jgi:hypothetical protein
MELSPFSEAASCAATQEVPNNLRNSKIQYRVPYPKLDQSRDTGFSDFVHRPDSKLLKTQRFGNWICFRPQVREDTYSVGSLRNS